MGEDNEKQEVNADLAPAKETDRVFIRDGRNFDTERGIKDSNDSLSPELALA